MPADKKITLREFMTIQTRTVRSKVSLPLDEAPEIKPITVRIPVFYLDLLDRLAEETNQSRQGLAGYILTAGINDALNGYADAFENPDEVLATMYRESGFPSND